MLKIEANDKVLKVAACGSMSEISAELVKVMQEIRKGFAENSSNGYIFDIFLKDVFIDLIFSESEEEVADVLANSLRRMCEKDETEHKQD